MEHMLVPFSPVFGLRMWPCSVAIVGDGAERNWGMLKLMIREHNLSLLNAM